MKNKFDELAKDLARTVTRRAALKKFGLGFTGLALACLGLGNKAEAKAGGCKHSGVRCSSNEECCSGYCPPSFSNAPRYCF